MNYIDLQNRLNSYQLALSTVMYDALTIAPKNGAAYRNQAMAILSGEHFKIMTSEETYQLLLENKNNEDLLISESATYQLEELEKIKNIPQDVFVGFNELKNNAQQIWENSRENSDYSLFEPTLKKLVETSKEGINYRNNDEITYEQLLGDFEKGLTIKKVSKFFELIKKELVPFIDQVIEKQAPKPKFLSAHVPIEKQEDISKLIMDHLGYKSDFGYIAVAAHPFSSTFSLNDTRITTNYIENDFTSNIFSVIHEIGHSLYNHNVNPEFEGLPISGNMSYSMHESQSRFLENNIGRSKEFWLPIYGKLEAIIPNVLGNISLDEFIRGINYVEKAAIRIEADELTYPLHILIRYEIEKEMFSGQATTKNLNMRFADLMEEYLGIRPKNDANGILQDVHWSDASFGYFPTYALGSAYAAQFMYAMKKDINLDSDLMTGDLTPMFLWLNKEIHQYGGLHQADTILKRATGEAFDANYYIKYLKDKYSDILGI